MKLIDIKLLKFLIVGIVNTGAGAGINHITVDKEIFVSKW